ncbi:MAG TPA: single-stranded-DNA-specific exonuclease RecJ [Candidatus Paceibacterota bacterium]|nr:single-stranded-DNA-specific exonuclease RecJ [Candidatus Paceibacterota bacterium]
MNYAVRTPLADKPAELGAFSDVVANLLYSRGVRTAEDAAAFLTPDYDSHTHDPFLMRDMDKAVERVHRAVKNNEKIIIYSDYDADGIPGGVVLHDALKKIGYDNFENYIPHRHDEGFGLNSGAIQGFKESGAKLLITIDCGIADLEEVAEAMGAGIDVVVTDHHMPPLAEDGIMQRLPDAYAILNPKVASCAYPEKMLCGSGVVFKFVQAFFRKHGAEFGIKQDWEKWFLDMVGIATLSDMVPLTGENRTLAFYGLKVLKKTARPGLSQLFRKLRVKREYISEDDVGFTITPRINAASRMGEPKVAFDLLSTSDEALAGAYADALEHVNNERKGTVAALVKEVKKILAERDIVDKKAIVLGNPAWRPSLLGLVANSLAEEYGRPAFLWGRDGEGVIKGSCRSGKTNASGGAASVLAIMQKTPASFIAFGGHGASGGFEVSNESVHMLAESLEKAAEELSAAHADGNPALAQSAVEVDAVISLEEISWDLYKDIEKLAPFGVGNPKPMFLVKGAFIDAVKSFGKEGNHTELIFRDLAGRKISAIQFFSPTESLPKHVAAQKPVDIVAHIEKSTFKNYPELRLRIVDIL